MEMMLALFFRGGLSGRITEARQEALFLGLLFGLVSQLDVFKSLLFGRRSLERAAV